jgi:carboxypeptidase Taq
VRTHQAWEAARSQSAWRKVLPHFAELVVLTREKALLLRHGSEPYDALLEEYEEGLTATALHIQLDALRDALKPFLSDLRRRSPDMGRSDRAALASIRSVPLREQRPLAYGVATALGFDSTMGRFSESAHPFTVQINRSDVRFTAAYRENDAFFGVGCAVHEMGHWLHAQGVDGALYGTPSGESSFTVSEGVARFYEVIIGLGLPFMEWLMPRLPRQVPPQVACRALNYPVGNGIRLDASDAEYDLCIAMRVTIERPLINGSLLPHEVPDAWHALSFDHLGVAPTDHARGVLQDDHWYAGSFGYFGTYSRGNMFASQLEAAMRRDMPDFDEVIRRGEFANIAHWLHQKVFRHGGLMTTSELARHATGADLGTEAHLTRIKRRYTEIFG